MRPTERLGRFARHFLAYSLSQLAAKASRLLVVIAVARTMDSTAIGVAAASIAAADILKALTENGVGQRIIAATERDLAATCLTASRIYRVWCLGLFTIQLGVAGIVWWISDDAAHFWLITVLAGEYLFMPWGLVHNALAMRDGKMRQTAAIGAGQVVGANALTALMALFFPGPMALVLPRLLVAPLWTLAMRRLHPWTPEPGVAPAPLAPFLRYGWAVLGVEVVKALRLQADKLVIGAMLGTKALGLYFMAFNAGLGLANSLAMAFSVVLFPHLCSAHDPRRALRQAMGLGTAIISFAVILQALAAPYYVPVLFGAQWNGISNVVSILCLAAIPGVIWSGAAQWLRRQDRPHVEFLVTLALTAALIANTVICAPYGLTAIAWGYLLTSTITQLAAAIPTLAGVFRNSLPKTA
ncbi:oligosaccharide flippase family protein [Paracoccus sp. (in: a-proteobacteria)]|uniref:oligosaccharide flippase family protein n=1 Tax=Paracoccus sp. TaxID=267 RepID=UPI003A875ACF